MLSDRVNYRLQDKNITNTNQSLLILGNNNKNNSKDSNKNNNKDKNNNNIYTKTSQLTDI